MDIVNQQTAIMDKMLEPLTKDLAPETARLFAGLEATPEMVARLQILAEKCNEGTLSEEEQSEYESYVRVGNLFAILKANAAKVLSENG